MSKGFVFPVANGVHEFDFAGGLVGFQAFHFHFGPDTNTGSMTVERRAIGSEEWELVPGGEAVALGSPEIDLYADGTTAHLRLTFSDVEGDVGALLWVTQQPIAMPPFGLATDGATGPNARVRVDPGQTGFFARRMWRISHEFTALADTPQVFRVVIPVNFIIHQQDLAVDQGGIVLRVYRSGQGTPGGAFDTPIPLWSKNFMTERPEYPFQAEVDTGGTFTPTSGGPVESLRVRAANATAQQATVGGGAGFSERGLAPGTYYLVFSRMTGVNGDCKGVYTLVVEERP